MNAEAKINQLHGDVFRNQMVRVGDCRRWSRHFAAERRRPAQVSPVSTEEQTTEKAIRAGGCASVAIHPPQVDFGKAQTVLKIQVTPKGVQQEREAEVEIQTAALVTCTPLPPVEETDLQELHQTWSNIIQAEGLDDIEVLAEEMTEEDGEPRKDKSKRRRFLNWLNELVEYYYMKRIARTYLRELEEGNQTFRPSIIYPPITRAQREQGKRQKLLQRNSQRQRVKDMLDSYWAKHRREKELLILKEEERYEKWAAEHGLSAPDSAAGQPKRRMSKWEKRFLRLKDFFH